MGLSRRKSRRRQTTISPRTTISNISPKIHAGTAVMAEPGLLPSRRHHHGVDDGQGLQRIYISETAGNRRRINVTGMKNHLRNVAMGMTLALVSGLSRAAAAIRPERRR